MTPTLLNRNLPVMAAMTFTSIVVLLLATSSAFGRPTLSLDSINPFYFRRSYLSRPTLINRGEQPLELSERTLSALTSRAENLREVRNTYLSNKVQTESRRRSFLRPTTKKTSFSDTTPSGLTFEISGFGESKKASIPKKSIHPKSVNRGKTFEQLDYVSAEEALRPLENMADRFFQSQTVGVVDSIASHAIETMARLMDGAGLAIVEIIDRLPTTIDRVAGTVDDIVRTADSIGRGVAVIVTAPARVVLTGLHPEFRDRFAWRNVSTLSDITFSHLRERINNADDINNIIMPRASEVALLPSELALEGQASNLWTSFEERNNIKSDALSGDPSQVNLRNLMQIRRNGGSFLTTSLENFNNNQNVVKAVNIGSTRAPSDSRNLRRIEASSSNSNPFFDSTSQLLNSLIPRSPDTASQGLRRLSPLIMGFGNLTTNILNNMRSNRRNGTEIREKTVFERNFEGSRTQASISKLEDQLGGFLGRLLGTIYRNAEPIDESISEGIRLVLGVEPSSPKSTTPAPATPPPVKFRLTFDDIDPAPARHTDFAFP